MYSPRDHLTGNLSTQTVSLDEIHCSEDSPWDGAEKLKKTPTFLYMENVENMIKNNNSGKLQEIYYCHPKTTEKKKNTVTFLEIYSPFKYTMSHVYNQI